MTLAMRGRFLVIRRANRQSPPKTVRERSGKTVEPCGKLRKPTLRSIRITTRRCGTGALCLQSKPEQNTPGKKRSPQSGPLCLSRTPGRVVIAFTIVSFKHVHQVHHVHSQKPRRYIYSLFPSG